MANKKKLVAFTGGGTGGHVYPGLAILDELSHFLDEGGFTVAWIGSKKGMERRIVEERGISYAPISAGKLRRYLSFENLIDLFKVALALFQSLLFMLTRRPVLLFSKGGYVSVPPVIAARICGIPVVTHESDLDPGLATRINARFAHTVCVSYAKTCDYFPEKLKAKLKLVGNPIRRSMRRGDPQKGRTLFGLPGKKPLIFVIGGSLGARQINDLISTTAPDLLEQAEILHQTGGGNQTGIAQEGYVEREYIGAEMADALAAADLVVSRAGAGSLWECGALGKAMILIPLDASGSRGDQIRNARHFEEAGAARVLAGEQVTPESLKQEVLGLLAAQNEREALGRAAAKLAGRDGAAEAAALIRELLRR